VILPVSKLRLLAGINVAPDGGVPVTDTEGQLWYPSLHPLLWLRCHHHSGLLLRHGICLGGRRSYHCCYCFRDNDWIRGWDERGTRWRCTTASAIMASPTSSAVCCCWSVTITAASFSDMAIVWESAGVTAVANAMGTRLILW